MEEMLFLLCMFYTLPISHVTLITSFHLKNEEMNANKTLNVFVSTSTGRRAAEFVFLSFVSGTFFHQSFLSCGHPLPPSNLKNEK